MPWNLHPEKLSKRVLKIIRVTDNYEEILHFYYPGATVERWDE